MEKQFLKQGCVYFFRHIGLSPVKIGFSYKEHPASRFKQFKIFAPYGGEILGIIITDTPELIERVLHEKYSSLKINGEWFEITNEQVQSEVVFYAENKIDINYVYPEITKKRKGYFEFQKYVKINPDFNKTEIATEFLVSRKTIYKWLQKISK